MNSPFFRILFYNFAVSSSLFETDFCIASWEDHTNISAVLQSHERIEGYVLDADSVRRSPITNHIKRLGPCIRTTRRYHLALSDDLMTVM